MLATTFNDEVNTMAVREFAHEFGRANVYQLPSPYGGTGKRVSIAEHLRGRKLFGDEFHHDEIAMRLATGAVVKKTQLTDSFGYDDFLHLYGPTAVLLFVIDDDKRLLIRTAGDKRCHNQGTPSLRSSTIRRQRRQTGRPARDPLRLPGLPQRSHDSLSYQSFLKEVRLRRGRVGRRDVSGTIHCKLQNTNCRVQNGESRCEQPLFIHHPLSTMHHSFSTVLFALDSLAPIPLPISVELRF